MNNKENTNLFSKFSIFCVFQNIKTSNQILSICFSCFEQKKFSKNIKSRFLFLFLSLKMVLENNFLKHNLDVL